MNKWSHLTHFHRKHKVRIDANFATLVVNVLCIESLARRASPSYNVLDASKPLLRSYRNLCYHPDGTPKLNARRSRLVRLWLSTMYLKKTWAENIFFGALKVAAKKTKDEQGEYYDVQLSYR